MAPPEEIGHGDRRDCDAVDYIRACIWIQREDDPFTGMQVALDCANGCASVTAPKICLSAWAHECHLLHAEPNGLNINQNCGSTHIGGPAGICARHMAAIWALPLTGMRIAAWRWIENGELVDGDQLMAIFALGFEETWKA